MSSEKPRVTGIGGIFFKAENPEALKAWYAQNLGLDTDAWGTTFKWLHAQDATQKGFTQWSPFSVETTYFDPSSKDFMINYRVVHLEKLVAQLQQNGVTIVDDIETFEYGKFVHILDNEGNKIELWEPNDSAYEKLITENTQ